MTLTENLGHARDGNRAVAFCFAMDVDERHLTATGSMAALPEASRRVLVRGRVAEALRCFNWPSMYSRVSFLRRRFFATPNRHHGYACMFRKLGVACPAIRL